MRPFWKCLIVIKHVVRTKLKFYPFWKNWGLISIFGPIGTKSKNPHKFSSLHFLMLNETILEMWYSQLNFGNNRLEILPFGRGGEGGPWSRFPYLGSLAQNKKRPLIETLWSSWSVKYLVGFLLPKRNKSWQETLCFLNIRFL